MVFMNMGKRKILSTKFETLNNFAKGKKGVERRN
jgi:hypothetical protein